MRCVPEELCTKSSLELARDLLNRAERDENHPIPVIFNLTSWADRRQPLSDWLVEELNTKYLVPPRLGRVWVEADQIALLLDALDEVPQDRLGACINAINTFRREHALVPTVVCCRSSAYLSQSTLLLLRSAVVVQPLTSEQIDEYLAGAATTDARLTFHSNPGLRDLVTTPLMLSVLALDYNDQPVETIPATSTTGIVQQQVWDAEAYIQRMLQRRGRTHYTSLQTIKWLTWLALEMTRHGQVEFYLEQLQPDWIPEGVLRRLYQLSISRILFGFVGWLLVVLIFGPFVELLGLLVNSHDPIFSGSLVVLVNGGILGILFMVIGGPNTSIKPAEILVWSWKNMLRKMVESLRFGAFVGVGFALFVGVVIGIRGSGAFSIFALALVSGVASGMLVVLVSGFLGGWSSGVLDERLRSKPNVGIRRSVRISLFVGLLGGLGFGVLGGLGGGVPSGVGFGVLGFFGGCLLGGGSAWIKHVMLRWLLWRAGCMPLNYARFLDYAAQRILLRKVGGGYVFIHQQLLDYFVSLNHKPPPTGSESATP